MPCVIKNNANIDLSDLESHIHGMYDHFHQKYGFKKPPVVVFDTDPSNQSNVLGKTAYYDPQSLEVHVFTDGRHPKDLLRSIAHELIHHLQNLEGRLDVGGYNGPGYYLENDKMRDIEQEAMLDGNATLREYEDGLKLRERDKMSLKEWKNNELNQLLLKKFGILKECNCLEGSEINESQEIEESVSSRSEDVKTGRRQGREGSKTQPDRLHEDELEEGGLADREENTERAAGKEAGGRFKNIKEAVKESLEENKVVRLKIKR